MTRAALPNPRRIVIGATAHAALAERLRPLRPDLEVRGAPHTDLTADDLAWADTYVGFRRPPLPTMGNVRWVHCTGAGVDSWLQSTFSNAPGRPANVGGGMNNYWQLLRGLNRDMRMYLLADGLSGVTVDGGIYAV